MKRYLCILFCVLQTLLASPQNKVSVHSANNPIIPDMIADPSIVEIGGVFYCYATTDGYNQGLAASGPPAVWKSEDLVSWSFEGTYFPSAKHQLYWAPSTVKKAGGKYYIYPTINRNIHVGVADSPQGPFRLANGADTFNGPDAAKPLVMLNGPKGTKGIDAEVFVDDDGSAYMFWAQRGAARLQKDMVTLDTATVVIATKRQGYSEGPFVFKRKGIYYYLYTLEGHENYQYAYGYSHTSPLGPYTFPRQDIIAATDRVKGIYGPGHGCVFSDSRTGQYYFAYLEFGNGSTNRQVWVDKLEFNDDGSIRPVILTHTGVSLPQQEKNINLALGKKTSASSVLPALSVKPIKDSGLHRTERYEAGNAVDDLKGTRWMADSSDAASWFMVDLGRVMDVKRTEAYFVKPTAGHAYRLEYSPDGINWKNCGSHEEIIIQSPHTDVVSVNARYVRVTVLKGTAGLWELKVYGD